LAKTGTGIARGIGGLTGIDAMRDWAERTEDQVEGFYDPQGRAGTVGEFGGRLLGEGATAMAGGMGIVKGLARVAPGAASRLAAMQAAKSTGGVGGAVRAGAQRLAGTVGPVAPVSAVLGAGYRPDAPFRGAAEGVALDAVGGLAIDAVGAGLRQVPRAAASLRRIAADERGFLGSMAAAPHIDPNVRAVLAQGDVPVTARGVVARAGDSVKRLYQKMVDDVYAAREFGRKVGGGEELSEALSTARGHGGLTEELLGTRTGQWTSVANPAGITLRYARAMARGIEDDVIAFTRARRAIDLDDAGMGWKAETFDRAQAEAVLARYAEDTPVQDAADALTKFYDGLLEMRHKAGLLDDEALAAIKAKHPSYVPFVRDFGIDDPFLGGAGTGGARGANRTSGVRKMEVGDARAAIVDPYEQAVRDAQRTAKDVLRQRVMQNVASIMEASPEAAAAFLREVPAGSSGREGRVFRAVVNGKQRSFEVLDNDLFDALAATAPETQGLVRSILSAPARALRFGITITPDFMVRNAVRDAGFTASAYGFPLKSALRGATLGAVGGAALDSEDRLGGALTGAGLGFGGGIMARHAARIAGGMGHIMKNDDLYRQWLAEGGSGGTGFFVKSRADAKKVLRDLEREGVSPSDVVNPKRWVDALRYVNEAVEQAPRVARFADQLGQGATPMAAAASARDVSVDFSRRSGDALMGVVASTTAFFNPKIQGWDKLVRAYKDPKAWALGVATLTAPSLALYNINKDDPAYQQLPTWQKNLFWLVPAGKHDDGSTRFLRVPKPFEPGMAFASMPERLAEFFYTKDPAAFRAAMAQMGSEVAEGLAPIPTALKVPGELATNFDAFRGSPIVPQGVQNAPAEEQTFPHTTNVARGVGKALGVSPIKVDHAIRGVGGSAAAHLTQGVDPLLQKAGVDKRPPMPERRWTEQPMVRSFFTGPTSTSITADTDEMWRLYDKGKPYFDHYSEMLSDAGDDPKLQAAADRYADKHREAIAGYFQVESQVTDARTAGRERRAILADRTLTPAEKRRLLQRVGAAGNAAASDAVRRTQPTP